MRRLISLLLASAAVAAAVRMLTRRKDDPPSPPQPSVMPRPTAARTVSQEEPMHDEPVPEKSETPGPISEGDPGAITAAPVPEEPAPEPSPTREDSELERAVEAEIGEDTAVPAEGVDVDVDVESGVARLTGSVPDEDTALRLGDDAARVDGIIGLEDELQRGEAKKDEKDEPAPRSERPDDSAE